MRFFAASAASALLLLLSPAARAQVAATAGSIPAWSASSSNSARATARELNRLARQIEKSCPELVRLDPTTGLKSVRTALLAPTVRQFRRMLDDGDAQPAAHAEVLSELLAQLQRVQQLSGPDK